jgi:hypothetical protein
MAVPESINDRHARIETFERTAVSVAERIEEYSDIIVGLAALRGLGQDGQAIADAAIELRDLRVLRLSWELLDALIESDGLDGSELLNKHTTDELVDCARIAIWGEGALADVVSIADHLTATNQEAQDP